MKRAFMGSRSQAGALFFTQRRLAKSFVLLNFGERIPLGLAMPADAEKQLAGFIAKFAPQIAKAIRECRAVMRKRFPAANELVYDNYNFFVIGYCTTEKPSDCIVSIIANAKGLALSFYYGATLPDPCRILHGSGSQNRFVRLENGPSDLRRREIREVLQAAEMQARTPLPAKGKGQLIIRSVSEKQRPRR
jgi:hypothetical protein